jgi:hypothetical protein
LEVTLPSGHTVHMVDQFLRGMRRRARPGQRVTFTADGQRHVDLPSEDDVKGRILRDAITGWDFGDKPLPRDAPSEEAAQSVLDTLEDDDYEELCKAIEPFFKRVMGSEGAPEDPNSRSGGTGTSGAAKPDGQETLSI